MEWLFGCKHDYEIFKSVDMKSQADIIVEMGLQPKSFISSVRNVKK